MSPAERAYAEAREQGLPERVAAWWTRSPAANIGVATGYGLVVVDLDGPEGCERFTELQRRHGPCGAAWWQQTARGWHAVYSGDAPSSAGRVAAGIDVRGHGGYIVAGPSVHPSGFVYRWHATPGDAPGALPGWLRRLADPPPSTRPAVRRVVGKGDRYARAALEGEVADVAAAREGTRNERLYQAAYRLGRFVAAGLLDGQEVADELLAAGQRAGLGNREACRTIASGLNRAQARPLEVSA